MDLDILERLRDLDILDRLEDLEIAKRLSHYRIIGLIIALMISSIVLMLFSDQVASFTRIPQSVIAGGLGGGLVVGTYQGVSMIREILKEHNERRRKHSNVLKRCLELWLSIPFEKDKLFDNPQSIWLDECMQHFYSYTKTYEFVDADFHPLSITIGRLFSEYMEPYVRRQHEISIEIKQKLIEVVTNIIKGVNKAFTDSSVGERIFDSEHSHQRIDPTTLNQAQSSFTRFEDTSRQIWIVITRRSRGLVL